MKQTSPVFTECDVTYVPVFLGGIMKETGNRPPISVPSGSRSYALLLLAS